jgi:cell division protein ZapB
MLCTDAVARNIRASTRLDERPSQETHDVEADDLKALESRIDQLIELCQRLKNENKLLKSEQGSMNAERARLMEKTRVARERIESMIDRLKALERG